MRSTMRMTGFAKKTVERVQREIGKACVECVELECHFQMALQFEQQAAIGAVEYFSPAALAHDTAFQI